MIRLSNVGRDWRFVEAIQREQSLRQHLSNLTVQTNGLRTFPTNFEAYATLRLCLQLRQNRPACALRACPVT